METTEKPKRTYQKHKTEKKITVKHYVNTNFKQTENELGFTQYPVYVQVTYNRKNTKFKSKIPYTYLTQLPFIPILESIDSFKEYYVSTPNGFERALIRESNFINWLVEQQISKKGDNFKISELPNIYHSNFLELSYFTECSLKMEIQNTLCEITGHTNLNKYLKYVLFPTPIGSSALINFEYYLQRYPELIKLKAKYSSQVWLLNMYEELGDSSNGIHCEPMFSYIDEYEGEVIAFKPTIFDYLTNLFQKELSDRFQNPTIVNHIFTDIDKLFLEYYSEYYNTINL